MRRSASRCSSVMRLYRKRRRSALLCRPSSVSIVDDVLYSIDNTMNVKEYLLREDNVRFQSKFQILNDYSDILLNIQWYLFKLPRPMSGARGTTGGGATRFLYSIDVNLLIICL